MKDSREEKNKIDRDTLYISEKIRKKSLSLSVKDGCATGVAQNLGDEYMTPYALILNAQPIHIGILHSITGLLSPLGQYIGSKLMKRFSRKKIVINFALMQGLMWIPIVLLAILMYFDIARAYLPWLLILFYTAIVIVGSVKYPAWFSWIGDLVPEKHRGKYFSLRNKLIGIVGLIAALIASFVLDFAKEAGMVLIGFSILFIGAGAARMFSTYFLKKEYAPKLKLNDGDYFSFKDFIKKMDNFGRFAIYLGLFNLSIMMASPFFTVYMLEELKFSYITFMIVSLSSTAVYLLALPWVGSFGDKYGNKKLLVISNFLFVLGPIAWIFLKDPIMLIAIPQIIAGIANAAFVISSTNFIYDSVSQKHRALCLTYSNIFAGVGIFIGSIAGGLILNYYHPTSINPYLFLFGVAAVIRLLVAIIYLPKIKEANNVKSIPLPSFEINHPIRAAYANFVWLKQILR